MNKCKKILFWYVHNYNKYRVVSGGDIARHYLNSSKIDEDLIVGKYIIQIRECIDCGYTKIITKKSYS